MSKVAWSDAEKCLFCRLHYAVERILGVLVIAVRLMRDEKHPIEVGGSNSNAVALGPHRLMLRPGRVAISA